MHAFKLPYKTPSAEFPEAFAAFCDFKINAMTKTGSATTCYWQSEAAYDKGLQPFVTKEINFTAEFDTVFTADLEEAIEKALVERIAVIPQPTGEFEDDPAEDNKPGLVHEIVDGAMVPDEDDPTGFKRIPDPTFVPRKRAVTAEVFKDAVPVVK